MALPKEPRQKMINLMYLVLTALLALNVSAEVIDAFKTVDKSLMKSNESIEKSNATLFKSFASKKADPTTREKAEEWGGKADKAKQLSDEMQSYLDNLKKELKTASGLTLKDGQEDYKLDDLNASSRLMDTEKKGKELDDKLRKFRTDMLAIDPQIKANFESTFPVDVDPTKDNTTAGFRMMPTVAAITLLSKVQNNIKNAENQIVSFAHSKIGEVVVRYDKFGVLVGQTSNYVMPGQEVVITAGIGAYSSQAQPVISINGAGVPTVDGKGEYKITASGAGERRVPVTIRYKDQNGVVQTATSEVKYTVGTPGGAAVMLDKMNVFYIGVDNPVTIGSSTGWDKTSVNMSGGTISGSGSSRSVRVSNIGPASITVTADGKSSTFPFRVKKIPSPVFKVGSGRPRVPAVEFKNQQFSRAELENFDFDLRFSVLSATVYFAGAGFPSVVTQSISGGNLGALSGNMQKCIPGSSITFDNVKVSGPDGTRTIDGITIQLY